MKELYDFYRGRIESAPNYGFVAGHQIIALVCKTAFWDSLLTTEEVDSIINLCGLAHIKMMEDNYNDGWSK